MEDIIKVSIANVAFSIEREAHLRLEQYISSLEEHYAENPNADEIVSGIEERISEILSERGYRERIVPVAMVEELIAILGSVEDLDGDYVNSGTRKTQLKKRLYRDVENKLVGGVCAGLGAYFGLDPIIFRLAFSLAVILSIVFESELFLLWVVIYILLWIITPAAVTSFQKCRMRGEENNIGAIQRGVENGTRAAETGSVSQRKIVSGISRVFSVVFGVFVLGAGLLGLLTTICGALGVSMVDWVIPFSVADFITMVTVSSKWVSVLFIVSIILVAAIPAVALIYWGLLLLFHLKSPKWRPGLIMFILWIISLIGLVVVSFSYVSALPDNSDYYEKIGIAPADTIYVEYVDYQKYNDYQVLVDGNRGEYNLFYIKDTKECSQMACYPLLEVHRNERFIGTPYLVSSSLILHNTLSLNDIENLRNGMFWSYSERTLYLSPRILEKDTKMTDIFRKVVLWVGPDVKVVVKNPVPHEFDSSFEFTDWKLKAVIDLFD